MVPYADLNALPDPDSLLATFFQQLGHHQVRRATGGLSEFHDLYAETLVGEGDYNHDGIDTPLVEAVNAPDSADKAEKPRLWPCSLTDCAFVRLMRDRGVLNVELHEEWSHHNKGLNRFKAPSTIRISNPVLRCAVGSEIERKDEDAFGSPPEFTGGLFEPVLDNEDDYDITDGVMQDVLTVFIEGESRTVINEAACGSLLESYRATDETDL